MANYVSPYEVLSPWLQPLTPQIEKGIAQGTQIAKLRSEMPYMEAHAKLAAAQAGEKEEATRKTQEAYNYLKGGGKLITGPKGPMDPYEALMWQTLGLKDSSHFLLPKSNINWERGLSAQTLPGGTPQISPIPGVAPKRTPHFIEEGPNKIFGTYGPSGDFEPTMTQEPWTGVPFPVPEPRVATAPIRETPAEAGAKTTAQKQAEEDVIQKNEAARIEREKKLAEAKREPIPQAAERAAEVEKKKGEAGLDVWQKKQDRLLADAIKKIKENAAQGITSVVAMDENGEPVRDEDGNFVLVNISRSEAKGRRVPGRGGQPRNIYNVADPTQKKTIKPGEAVPDGWVLGNPPKTAGFALPPRPVATPQTGTSGVIPAPKKVPSKSEWIAAAKRANPTATDAELDAFYTKKYGKK